MSPCIQSAGSKSRPRRQSRTRLTCGAFSFVLWMLVNAHNPLRGIWKKLTQRRNKNLEIILSGVIFCLQKSFTLYLCIIQYAQSRSFQLRHRNESTHRLQIQFSVRHLKIHIDPVFHLL